MCGIAGYFGHHIDPSAGMALIQAMTGAVRHRGPDGEGAHVEGSVGLGHTRLAIVDLLHGRQPMSLADRDLWITFNGEIFNHVELREDLIARGHRLRTSSDTEVILHLYAESGPDCLARMNGDFAFALWDGRRRRIMLARDRMGVRPLFYTRRHGSVFFASEVKSLLKVPGIAAELDPIALDQTFSLWAPIPPRTHFKEIFELPPAHLMLIDANGSRIAPYWSLDFPRNGQEEDGRSQEQLEAEARLLLDDATSIRLRADVPVGSYLSGGLDSAIVAALAARYAPARLDTFSVTFESAEYDESIQQAQMVRLLDTVHSEVACRKQDIAAVFPDVIRHAEKPVLRTAAAPLHLLSRLVRAQGHKVVLTGEGADEVFAGYDIFKEAAVRRFCGRQPSSAARTQLLRRLYPYLPGLTRLNARSRAAFFGIGTDALDDPLFSHRPRMRSTAAAKLFFSGDLSALLGDYSAAEELAGTLPGDFKHWHPLNQGKYLETTLLLPGYILSSQGDRMAMAHGVEGRFPFLDHRVVEFAARVPPRLQLKGLKEKYLLRRATADLLPRSIATRAKQPYRAPDSQSFSGHDVPAYVHDQLSCARARDTGLFNPVAVERLAAKCREGAMSGMRDNAALVGVLSTQLWHDIFVRGSFQPVDIHSDDMTIPGRSDHASNRRTDTIIHQGQFPLRRHSA